MCLVKVQVWTKNLTNGTRWPKHENIVSVDLIGNGSVLQLMENGKKTAIGYPIHNVEKWVASE